MFFRPYRDQESTVEGRINNQKENLMQYKKIYFIMAVALIVVAARRSSVGDC